MASRAQWLLLRSSTHTRWLANAALARLTPPDTAGVPLAGSRVEFQQSLQMDLNTSSIHGCQLA